MNVCLMIAAASHFRIHGGSIDPHPHMFIPGPRLPRALCTHREQEQEGGEPHAGGSGQQAQRGLAAVGLRGGGGTHG
jgi:hypothetical protein